MSSESGEVGLGCMSDEISDATPALIKEIWNQMIIKIKHPELYLPVKNVKSEDRDGFVYRTMEFAADGPMKGTLFEENIYEEFDGEVGVIRFVTLKDGVVTDMEIVNELLKGPARIEYYQRNYKTGERIYWKAPAAPVMGSINKTIENARKDCKE